VQTLFRLSKNGTGRFCTAEEMQSGGVDGRKRTDADGGIEMEQMMLSGLTEMEYRIKTAIDRLQAFEPEEGYYLAFSGGKDSQCIYHLAVEAGVKFDAHYNLTTVDPPELVNFIRKQYPDVSINYPKTSMWKLIEKNGLPTRSKRYCCKILKEGGGEGRICITGVRWAESIKRKNNRRAFEIMGKTTNDKMLFNDNDDGRRLFENCQMKGKRIINPIIDWTDANVWDYIKSRKLPYCKLYDQGRKRIGCIGCPLAGSDNMINDFERWPKYYYSYIKAIERFIPGYLERCKKRGASPFLTEADKWMEWWINGKTDGWMGEALEGQEYFG
jgi:phosphoadenosine phosphosulfate reductase